MKDWLAIAGFAIVASLAWGTIPILLLYWRRQRARARERDQARVAALEARIKQLEAALEHRDRVT
jgi:hypothetical protein